ncbi:MFS transporter [Gorillibacterium massiliense]|uniref:MFS transporter n=1 Tax=Gorillibacterium massiliense TaxID=1280390 RepID=UPI0004B3F8C8|nr:MFS transporter [Gorillibacterium massiliense]
MNPNRKKKARTVDLSLQAKWLLLVNGLYVVANALSGTFVNVYLWKVKNDLAMLGWFALYQQAAMALTFWLCGKWAKEGNIMNCLRTGLATAALFYLVVLVLGSTAVQWIPLLGIVQGLTSGFFWLAFNVLYFEITGPEDRDSFNGWAGLLGSAAGMAAPWISGQLIFRLKDVNGYRLIFALSLGVFVAAFFCSFLLKKRKAEGRYLWSFGARIVRRKNGVWRRVLPALVAQGLREGVIAFMIPVLVYISTRNEMKLGNYSLVTYGVALFTFLAAGRYVRPHRRKWAMLIGGAGMTAVVLPFFKQVSYGTLLFYGVGTALFLPLFFIPVTSVVFDLIGREQDGGANRVEYIVVREVAINAGRIIGTVVFIGVVSATTSSLATNLLLFGINLSTIAVWLLLIPWLGAKKGKLSGMKGS